MFALKADLIPQEFLLSQLSGGQAFIGCFIKQFHYTPPETINSMLSAVFQDLWSNFMQNRPLVVALDEANLAHSHALFGKFQSPNNYPRGLLAPINQFLTLSPTLNFSVIWAGTALNLVHRDTSQSNIGKYSNLDVISSEFDSEEQPLDFLCSTLNISPELMESILEDPTVPVHELQGRRQIAGRVIMELIGLSKENKERTLKMAIKKAVKFSHDHMKAKLSAACQETPEIQPLIRTILFASLMTSGKLPLMKTDYGDSRDLMHIGICQLIGSETMDYWKLSEPLAIHVCCEVLLEQGN